MENKRPVGVSFSAFLAIIYSIFILRVSGFPKALLYFLPGFLCSLRYELFVTCEIYNILGCIAGIILFVGGVNVLRLKNWARRQVIFASILLIIQVVEVITEANIRHLIYSSLPVNVIMMRYLFIGVFFSVVPLLLLFYLTRKHIRSLFLGLNKGDGSTG